MATITIDRSKCSGCGLCLAGCSARLFQFPEPGKPPVILEEDQKRCLECGHCVCLCPNEAITAGTQNIQNCLPVEKENMASFEELVQLVKSRRSIRDYKKEPIKQEDLNRLFELVRWAPTARNLLPLQWVVVNGPDRVHELSKIMIEGVRGDESAKLMVDAWDNGYDWPLRGAPCLIFVYTDEQAKWTLSDAAIAIETMELGATALGIGACWAGIFMIQIEKNEQLRAYFGLKKGDRIGAALMLGYRDREFYKRIPNRPPCSVKYI